MPAEFICDGCGKRAPGIFRMGHWYKPDTWYQRGWNGDDVQIACSRECIETISQKTGKTSVVMPI